ncbi:ketoacyl-ACP synthase III [Providencia stuartii]|uniref:ketoacyl-ACP synthase III n=1 Tax=Providencia stuartii TaxID=588 RepID=UPI00123B0345|nr:ketoacyl-ACP synthase III [Providencia stuartii]MDT7052270.1 ketoacyl-ACP synthase III [Providencia stuartii]QET97374.1 ketoacyl-ACP synthase III [Providencia stuartii]UQZ12935.1 ketoacyl-ACP synthase III [Providencia stuartii]HEM8145638.1 ketoacyl-ACP synthase III [Providencia stuartii]HEM8876210.1 ketoacyl-ACP synthase III [Providencia stuartii]
MYTKSISGINIKAIASSIPSTIVDEEDFSKLYGKVNAARVVRGTGIKSVRVATGLNTHEIISAAVESLLSSELIEKSDIDGVIVVTQTPDTWSPGTAFYIHKNIGLPENCLLLDLNSGCSGYANGIIQAAALINSGVCENIIVCTGDINTRLINNDDYQLRMLFGDAATATLITKGNDKINFTYGSDGAGVDLLGVNINYTKDNLKSAHLGFLKMDGPAVMSFALKRVPEVINTLLNEMKLDKDSIDLFALHQPNEFILTYIRDLLELESEKLPIDVDGLGNTNSSSIPLLLSRRSLSEKRNNVLICGFGVGLSWNAMLLSLNNTKIIEPIVVG